MSVRPTGVISGIIECFRTSSGVRRLPPANVRQILFLNSFFRGQRFGVFFALCGIHYQKSVLCYIDLSYSGLIIAVTKLY